LRLRLFFSHLIIGLILFFFIKLFFAPQLKFFSFFLLGIAVSFLISQLIWLPFARDLAYLTKLVKNQKPPAPKENWADMDFALLRSAILNTLSEQEKTVKKLLSRQEQMALILNSMRDGVILVDPELKIKLINPAALSTFKVKEEDVLNRHLIYAIHSQELFNLIKKVSQTKQEAETELELFLPQERSLKALCLPVLQEDKINGVLVITHDITGKSRLDAVRRDFVANVSHELKTPVASISLLADSLVTSWDKDPLIAKEFAQKLVKQSRQLSQLVRDLLDLSTLESPEIKVPFKPVSLSTITRKVVNSMAEKAAEKNLQIKTNLARGLPKINGNAKQLELMVRNLLDNAISYTQPEGKITVKTFSTSKYLALVVSDTGIGIPKKDLNRIFERFYRVDKTRSRETGGTGLGLSIVKHVIENHKGKIAVESTVGVGTKFTVLLPL